MKKLNLVKATVLAAGLAPAMGLAELTGNVGVTNNYIWRGVTQTGDLPAVSGGLDYSHESGFYAGTWISNVNFAGPPKTDSANDVVANDGYEQDYYAGFSGSSGDIAYDVGYIYWDYPTSTAQQDSDFGEVYGSVGYDFLTVQVNYTTNSQVEEDAVSGFSEGDIYYKATADFPLTDDGLGLSLTAGAYAFDDDGESTGPNTEADLNYTHYNAYLTKGDFSFGVEGNDQDDSSASRQRFVVSYSKSFDLM